MEKEIKKRESAVVCILSMHRSGSSMITRILNICGVYVGEEDELVGADDGNKKGHWEHKEVLKINEEILKVFGGSVVDVPNFPKNWQKDKRLDDLYVSARLFVNKMNKKTDFWGFKDPRTCITLPFWQEIIPNMVYIIPVRGILDVANSFRKRNNISLEYGMFLWISYWRKILKNTYGEKRFFTFQENYFVSWKSEIEKIEQFLNNKNFNFKDNEEVINEFISPGLLHKKIEQKKLLNACIDHDDFYPKEIMDLFLSDLNSLYKNNKKEGEVGEHNIKSIENELSQKKQKILQLNKEIELMKSSKFWKLRNKYIFLKNGMGFILFTPDRFFKKYFLKKKKKLIMTLLVRDEIDIIEENIKFHLAHGVDFVIATDNGSIDGTREVLQKYKEKGKLHLIDEPSQDYSQAIWVNRMGKIARERYGADYIFHCDADEFWTSKKGNLKYEISICKKEILKVDVINILLYDKGGEESFPDDTMYAVVKPFGFTNLEDNFKNSNFYLFKYPPKVIFRGFKEVIQGNHDVINVNECQKGVSTDLSVYHYPLRNKNQFFQKIINGGNAYSKNSKLDNTIGWHWRTWYDDYKHGKLNEDYKKLILNKSDIEKYTKNGVIKELSFDNISKKTICQKLIKSLH